MSTTAGSPYRPLVAVLDYGSGNVHSAMRALERAGARVELTRDRKRVMSADGLFVPGVGSFGAVMQALEGVHGGELIERRIAGGLPVLGVCVGMQVLFERGLEGAGEDAAPEPPQEGGATRADARAPGILGLDQWPGTVERLHADPLPHMGWNTVTPPAGSRLFKGVEAERFYFVHSYAAKDLPIDAQPQFAPPLIAWAEHGERFVAAVENGPLTATQFHPEKSGEAGLALLRNWLCTLPKLNPDAAEPRESPETTGIPKPADTPESPATHDPKERA